MKKDSILKRVKKRFTAKLKFIVFDQEMLHEIFSMRVRLINLFFSLLTVAVLLIVGTVLLIRYTPLKNYVNTDDLPHLRRQTAELLYRLDSLSSRQDINEAFILGDSITDKAGIMPTLAEVAVNGIRGMLALKTKDLPTGSIVLPYVHGVNLLEKAQ